MFFWTNAFAALCLAPSLELITLKFRLRWFPEEAGYSSEQGYTDIKLPPLMFNEDKNIGGSLIFGFKKMMTSPASQESC